MLYLKLKIALYFVPSWTECWGQENISKFSEHRNDYIMLTSYRSEWVGLGIARRKDLE